MKRTIIKIDEEKCNGCGACASACLEGAIAMIDGKAKLIRDDYCDGLGNCLPACPADAIHFEEREAAAYDHEAVLAHLAARAENGAENTSSPNVSPDAGEAAAAPAGASAPTAAFKSRLSHWPVQLKLAPVKAPYFDGAKLLIAADCTAYAYGNFHNDFMAGHVSLIGCPKLDFVDYSEKLSEIFSQNAVSEVLVARMEVPCCGGLERAVRHALETCKKDIPCRVCVIGTDGDIRSYV